MNKLPKLGDTIEFKSSHISKSVEVIRLDYENTGWPTLIKVGWFDGKLRWHTAKLPPEMFKEQAVITSKSVEEVDEEYNFNRPVGPDSTLRKESDTK